VSELPGDDLSKWEELPDNSVVLVDEAQRLVPFLGMRAPPGWVEAFTRHRHRGFDFWFVTQHPKLIDSTVRRLAGGHTHLHRTFGGGGGTKYFWEWCQDDPYYQGNKKMAVRSLYRHDHKLFPLYKSATEHTHKRRIPWVIYALVLFGVLGLVGLFNVIGNTPGMGKNKAHIAGSAEPELSAQGRQGEALPPPPPGQSPSVNSTSLVPRVTGIPWTAPAYDALTAPVEPPRLFCLIGSNGCRCYTQQVTRVDTPPAICRSIVEHGIYEPWLVTSPVASS
jgi:zona occludens toxin